ncbi:15324_t:CDS:2, partial [Rhizophagus irregularis]
MERNLSKSDIKFHPLNATNWKEDIDESILENYRFAGGRRFHNVEGVPYFLANDEEEISRLQMHHYLYRYIWQSIYSSPMHDKLALGNLKETDIETYFAGPLTKKFMKSFHGLLNARGLDPFIASRIESYLQSTNQVIDIHVEHKSTPLGSHGKKLGELLCCNEWTSISHAKAYICKFVGIPIEEYDDFVEKIKKEYDENKSYCKSY